MIVQLMEYVKIKQQLQICTIKVSNDRNHFWFVYRWHFNIVIKFLFKKKTCAFDLSEF